MSPTAENTIERLDAARQKWWLFSLLSTTVLAASLFVRHILGDDAGRCAGKTPAGVAPGTMLDVAGRYGRA